MKVEVIWLFVFLMNSTGLPDEDVMRWIPITGLIMGYQGREFTSVILGQRQGISNHQN